MSEEGGRFEGEKKKTRSKSIHVKGMTLHHPRWDPHVHTLTFVQHRTDFIRTSGCTMLMLEADQKRDCVLVATQVTLETQSTFTT
jgi:hypothetical protein